MHEYAADATATAAPDPAAAIDPLLWQAFAETPGFMPEDEARARIAARSAARCSTRSSTSSKENRSSSLGRSLSSSAPSRSSSDLTR